MKLDAIVLGQGLLFSLFYFRFYLIRLNKKNKQTNFYAWKINNLFQKFYF